MLRETLPLLLCLCCRCWHQQTSLALLQYAVVATAPSPPLVHHCCVAAVAANISLPLLHHCCIAVAASSSLALLVPLLLAPVFSLASWHCCCVAACAAAAAATSLPHLHCGCVGCCCCCHQLISQASLLCCCCCCRHWQPLLNRCWVAAATWQPLLHHCSVAAATWQPPLASLQCCCRHQPMFLCILTRNRYCCLHYLIVHLHNTPYHAMPELAAADCHSALQELLCRPPSLCCVSCAALLHGIDFLLTFFYNALHDMAAARYFCSNSSCTSKHQ